MVIELVQGTPHRKGASSFELLVRKGRTAYLDLLRGCVCVTENEQFSSTLPVVTCKYVRPVASYFTAVSLLRRLSCWHVDTHAEA